jgi:hypothetical protein
MATKSLSVPAIRVDNDVIGIVPNTFKFTYGAGETNVRAASTGGGNAQSVHSQNAETMFSKVMFSLYPTAENFIRIKNWKTGIANHTLEAMQRDAGVRGDFAEAFKGLSMTNDPDIVAAADGVIEIEMAGDRILQ